MLDAVDGGVQPCGGSPLGQSRDRHRRQGEAEGKVLGTKKSYTGHQSVGKQILQGAGKNPKSESRAKSQTAEANTNTEACWVGQRQSGSRTEISEEHV